MNARQNGFRGGWRRSAVLLVIVGGILAAGVSGLFADGPDYNNPKLRKGVFVPGDSTTTQAQAGWWNKRWKSATSDTNVAPLPAAVTAKALLDKNSPQPWDVGWVPGTGLVGGLSGRTSKKYTGDPVEIAQQFIAEYRPLITGLAPESDPGDMTFQKESFRKESFRKERDYTIVHLQQMHRGIPVLDSRVIVSFDPEGHVARVVANVHPVGDLDVTPALDSAAVCAALKAAILPDSIKDFGYVRLSVFPGKSPRLLYDVFATVWVDYGVDTYIFLIDARTGELLESQRLTMDDPGPLSRRRGHRGTFPDSSSAPQQRPDSVHIYKVPTQIRPGSKLDSLFKQPRKSSAIDRSTMPNPRPYELDPATVALKEKVGREHRTQKGANSAAWFWSVNFSPDENKDGDDYAGMSFVEWDADTYPGSSVKIYIKVYGHGAYGAEWQLAISESYWITGSSAEMEFVEVPVPRQGFWCFRLEIIDDESDLILATLGYGQAPAYGPALPLDNPIEPKQEDNVFVNLTYDPPDKVLDPDVDGDGYHPAIMLFYKICVEYDSTYALRTRIYARTQQGASNLIFESDEFELTCNNNDIIAHVISPWYGLHGLWDFRVDIAGAGGLVLSSANYGAAPNWTAVALERWNEDPRVTTVFCPNPIHSENDSTLWDQDDENDAVPQEAYFAVTLSHLDPPSGGLYHLTGTYVAIEDIESPSIPPPTSPDGLFPFFRGDDGFEAVMCYNWIDRAQVYLQSLGFSNAYNLQIHVDPHGMYGDDNSQYQHLPPLGTGYIACGDGGTDNAEDADVILHEYGHAIMDNLTEGIFRTIGLETRAMGDGFGDYFSASWTDSFYVTGFPPEYFAEWDSRATMGSPLFVRRLDSDKHYPEDMLGECHADGEIWSACLWQMKDQIGKRVTDSIVLRSFELMWRDTVRNPTFGVGARYILAADSAGYGAAHSTGLRTIFTNRGILSACNCGRTTTPRMWADVSNDVAIGPPDMVRMVKYVYSGQTTAIIAPPGVVYPNAPNDPPTSPITCQYKLGDVNRDGMVGPPDVVRYLKYVYQGQVTAIFDNPCQGGMEESAGSPSPIAGGPAD